MNKMAIPKHTSVVKLHDTLTKQHNALTEARYNISPLQKNILYLLFDQIKEAPLPQEPIKYKLSFKEINLSRNMRLSKEDIYEAAKSMIASGFTIYDDDEKGFISTGLLENAEYGEGIDKDNMIVQFDPKTWKFLYSVTRTFTLFSLQNALNLKSKYSKRIYEMLCQFKGVYKKCLVYNKSLPQNSKNKKECIINISVQELKERFGLIDLQTGKETYPDFGDFSRRVLKPADEEINRNTEISFEWIPVKPKTGKKITNLQFKITDVEGIEKLSDIPEYTLEVPKRIAETTQESTQSLIEPTVESIKKTSYLEKRLEECEMDPDDAKQVIQKLPANEIKVAIDEILKKHEAGEIKSKAGYSTKIFKAWLKGVKPTFEKKPTSKKHILLKSASQNAAQARMSETEITNKLKFKFKLNNEEIYGFVYHYAAELESLGKLEAAIRKIENLIDEGKINEDCILEKIEEQLNVELKKFNNELIFILVILYENFGLGSIDVRNLVKGRSIESLKSATVKVNEELKNGQISKVKYILLQRLREIFNNVEVKHFTQPLVTQANERSNSINTIESLLASSILKPSIPIESAEEEKIRREKTAIWQELTDLGMEVEKADNFVEEHSIEVLTHEISIAQEALKNQEVSQESINQAEELEKRLQNRLDLLNE